MAPDIWECENGWVMEPKLLREKVHWYKHRLAHHLLSFLWICRGGVGGELMSNSIILQRDVSESSWINSIESSSEVGAKGKKWKETGTSSLLHLPLNQCIFEAGGATEINEHTPFSPGNSFMPLIRIKWLCYLLIQRWVCVCEKPLYSIWFKLTTKKLNSVQISGTVLSHCILQQLNILYGISQRYDLICEHLQQSGTHFPLCLTFSSL